MRKRHPVRSAGSWWLWVLLTAVGCQAPARTDLGSSVGAEPTPLVASCRQLHVGSDYRARVTFLGLDVFDEGGQDRDTLVEVLRGDDVRARWQTHENTPFALYEDVLYRVEYSPGLPIGVMEDVVIAFDLLTGRERWRVPIPPSGPPPEGGWSFYSVRVALNPAHPTGVYVETVDHNGQTGWFLDRANGAVVSGPLRQAARQR